MKKLTEDIIAMIKSIMNQTKISKFSLTHKDSPKTHDPTTLVPANSKVPPFIGRYYKKIGCTLTLKHDIILPKFYELLMKTWLKGDTVIDLKNIYNHTNMYLNAITRLKEDLLTAYHSIKIFSEFEE